MKIKVLCMVAALSCAAAGVNAQVEVQNAWARATVKGQMATGAFMTLTAKDSVKLVGGASPVAGVTQVHEMKMDAGVMKMAELKQGLELPAGKAVELKPGGYHIMLMDLKQPLAKDSHLPLTLLFRDAKGVESRVELTVPVAATAPAGHAAAMNHGAHGAKPAANP